MEDRLKGWYRHKRHAYPKMTAVRALQGARSETRGPPWTPPSLCQESSKYWRTGRETSYFESIDSVPARFVGYCDKVARRIDHTGWFADDCQDSKYRGVVFRLNRNRGFIVGYQESDNDGIVLDLQTVLDSDDDIGAAYAADNMAERAAEQEREYGESWQAGTAARDKLDETINALRDDVRNLVRATLYAHDLGLPPEGWDDNGTRDDMMEAGNAIEPPCYSQELRAAYLEGFGGPVRLAGIGRPALVIGG